MGRKNIAIIGAGHVGATAAYALLVSRQVQTLGLLDMNESVLQGALLDLSHAASFYGSTVKKFNYDELPSFDYIVITAGPSQSGVKTDRLADLAKAEKIISSIACEFKEVNYKGKVIIASNPVDLMTYHFLKYSGLKKEQVIGTGTLLDTARYHVILADKLNVDIKDITGFVLGEHGASSFICFEESKVADKTLRQVIEEKGIDTSSFIDEMEREVKDSGFDILKTQGATYYGIGSTIATIIEALERDEETILPLSTSVEGEYGIADICISLPVKISDHSFKIIPDYPLSETERKKLIDSASILKSHLEK